MHKVVSVLALLILIPGVFCVLKSALRIVPTCCTRPDWFSIFRMLLHGLYVVGV